MPYDAVIEELKTLPENRLGELTSFIAYLKFSSSIGRGEAAGRAEFLQRKYFGAGNVADCDKMLEALDECRRIEEGEW